MQLKGSRGGIWQGPAQPDGRGLINASGLVLSYSKRMERAKWPPT